VSKKTALTLNITAT